MNRGRRGWLDLRTSNVKNVKAITEKQETDLAKKRNTVMVRHGFDCKI